MTYIENQDEHLKGEFDPGRGRIRRQGKKGILCR